MPARANSARRLYSIGTDEAGRAARKRTSLAQHSFVIGIDEAGRGPLAGPIVIAGVKIKIKSKIKNPRTIPTSREVRGRQKSKFWKGIRDSKKLTAKKREEWFGLLTGNSKIQWAATGVWPKTIDRINIARAATLGARRVHRKLTYRCCWKKAQHIRDRGKEAVLCCGSFLDGGLKLPAHIPHRVIIKGDEYIPIIAAASIVAKVIRDRTMLQLHKKYPRYGFDIHKGYATKLHRSTIRKYGYSDIHRKSFRLRNL